MQFSTILFIWGWFFGYVWSPIINTPKDDFITDVDASNSLPSGSITTPSAGHGAHNALTSLSLILSELENVTASLPWSIPKGLATDTLAWFSGNPSLELEDGHDAWEMADSVLSWVIGFGKTVNEIAAIIWWGPFGMDGFCRWLRALVYELKVDEILLEGKIKQLIDAMIIM